MYKCDLCKTNLVTTSYTLLPHENIISLIDYKNPYFTPEKKNLRDNEFKFLDNTEPILTADYNCFFERDFTYPINELILSLKAPKNFTINSNEKKTVYFNFKFHPLIESSFLVIRTTGFVNAISGLKYIEKACFHKRNFGIVIYNTNDESLSLQKNSVIAQIVFNLETTIEIFMLKNNLCPVISNNLSHYERTPCFVINTDYK